MAQATMSMYDMVKQLVANEVPMDPIQFTRKVNGVAEGMLEKDYWMLLCRERNDYTVFLTWNAVEKKRIVKELIPTLRNRGQVLLIDEQSDGTYEIWIRDSKTKEDFAYYLFDYTFGVVDCNE